MAAGTIMTRLTQKPLIFDRNSIEYFIYLTATFSQTLWHHCWHLEEQSSTPKQAKRFILVHQETQTAMYNAVYYIHHV